MIDVMIGELNRLYLCRDKHLVTELNIFWLGNEVEIEIFVYPVKF